MNPLLFSNLTICYYYYYSCSVITYQIFISGVHLHINPLAFHNQFSIFSSYLKLQYAHQIAHCFKFYSSVCYLSSQKTACPTLLSSLGHTVFIHLLVIYSMGFTCLESIPSSMPEEFVKQGSMTMSLQKNGHQVWGIEK